ncbi:hypothetical protein DVH24_036129 [Malus domestica]|uniref:Uncharacterized protein n=1 Tax=Malus domestica TaxID=3750 RepID=A0A498IDR7_MALDO|nr:hypothetical protein DVH24_036129 [Malus domestica]
MQNKAGSTHIKWGRLLARKTIQAACTKNEVRYVTQIGASITHEKWGGLLARKACKMIFPADESPFRIFFGQLQQPLGFQIGIILFYTFLSSF